MMATVHRRWIFIGIVFQLLCNPVWAAEKEPLTPHEQELRDYQNKQLEFQKKVGTVNDHEAEFKKLIEQKELAKDPKTKSDLMEQMKASHERFLQSQKQMLELKKELQYRYPDKGAKFDRQFMGTEGPRVPPAQEVSPSISDQQPESDSFKYALELANKRYPLDKDRSQPERATKPVLPLRAPASSGEKAVLQAPRPRLRLEK